MKVFLLSHIADADGVMPVILTDLAFEEYDYKLLEIVDVDNFMNESLDNNLFDSSYNSYSELLYTLSYAISLDNSFSIPKLNFIETFFIFIKVLSKHR